MGLFDFKEEFQLEKRPLFVAICIYEKGGFGTESPINKMLHQLQRELKREIPAYKEIQISYVYENLSLMDAKAFAPLTKHSPIYYKEPCPYIESHRFDHLFFMGMAMLEQKKQEFQNAETRLYIVTNEKIQRVNHVVWETEQGLIMHPRFASSSTKIYLCRPKDEGGDLIEDYIRSIAPQNILAY